MNHQSIRRNINKKRKKLGFLTFMKTKNGCKIIKKRRKKGRRLI
nr:50S ribosomal protein L34 [Synarthrophyton patena]UVF62844.1 50S ribosomal protein L34 [Synarthrophyton patena]